MRDPEEFRLDPIGGQRALQRRGLHAFELPERAERQHRLSDIHEQRGREGRIGLARFPQQLAGELRLAQRSCLQVAQQGAGVRRGIECIEHAGAQRERFDHLEADKAHRGLHRGDRTAATEK